MDRTPLTHNAAIDRRGFLATAALGALPAAIAWNDVAHAVPEAKRPVIDTHMHVWANDLKRYPFAHPYQKSAIFE